MHRPRGVALQPPAAEQAHDFHVVETGEDRLPQRGAVGGEEPAGQRGRAQRVGTVHAVEHHHLVPVHDREVRRLLALGGELLEVGAGDHPHVEPLQRMLPQLHELEAEVVAAGTGVLLHEPVVLQRHEDAVRGALVEARLLRDVADVLLGPVELEAVEDGRRAIEGLDPVPGRASVRPRARPGARSRSLHACLMRWRSGHECYPRAPSRSISSLDSAGAPAVFIMRDVVS